MEERTVAARSPRTGRPFDDLRAVDELHAHHDARLYLAETLAHVQHLERKGRREWSKARPRDGRSQARRPLQAAREAPADPR